MALVLALACSGCGGQDAQLDRAAQSVASVRATTTTVVRAWLDGELSDQFAHAAIERAYELSEQARTSIASSPASMADTRAAAMAQDCEQLSRLLARLGIDVDRRDRAAAQAALTSSPSLASSREEDR